jgi:hypothetical protein
MQADADNCAASPITTMYAGFLASKYMSVSMHAGNVNIIVPAWARLKVATMQARPNCVSASHNEHRRGYYMPRHNARGTIRMRDVNIVIGQRKINANETSTNGQHTC